MHKAKSRTKFVCITSGQPAQGLVQDNFLCITSDQPVESLVQNKVCVHHFCSACRSFMNYFVWTYVVLDSDHQLPVTDKQKFASGHGNL